MLYLLSFADLLEESKQVHGPSCFRIIMVDHDSRVSSLKALCALHLMKCARTNERSRAPKHAINWTNSTKVRYLRSVSRMPGGTEL